MCNATNILIKSSDTVIKFAHVKIGSFFKFNGGKDLRVKICDDKYFTFRDGGVDTCYEEESVVVAKEAVITF